MPSKSVQTISLKENITFAYPTIKKAVLVLRATGHPLRKQILHLLDERKKLPVTDIYVKLRQEQSVVSQHLAVLRKAGIVNTEKEGKFVYYTLNKERIAEIGNFIDKLTQ
jgi:ArsR family transcriptional regulator, virulence genes transcriptional regulator